MSPTLLKSRSDLEEVGIVKQSTLPSVIADSWQRNLNVGLDPLSNPIALVVSNTDLQHRTEKLDSVMRFIRPELELLSTQMAGPNFLIGVADADGVVLDVIIDEEFRGSACGSCMPLGSIWTENIRGTNGFGTAIFTGKSCLVSGQEHFFKSDSSLSCVAAPIFNSTGKLIAAIDISSEATTHLVHTTALANIAAQNVEDQIFFHTHVNEIIIKLHPRRAFLTTKNVGLIALSLDGQVMGTNSRTRELFKALLSGSDIFYSDIFMGRFEPILKHILNNETIQIKDCFENEYFAVLVPTFLAQTKPSTTKIFLPTESVYHLKKPTEQVIARRVFVDEGVRQNLRLGQKSAQNGLPIMIIGGPGTGKNTIAEEIHAHVNEEQNFIVFDCSKANVDSIESRLAAKIGSPIHDGAVQHATIDPSKGGTLYFDRIDLLPTDAAPTLSSLLNRFLHQRNLSPSELKWTILSSTETDDFNTIFNGAHKNLMDRLSGFSLFLPKLKNRSDLHHLSYAMLKSISSQHSLSKDAVDELGNNATIKNLYDLDWSLRTLSTQHHEGVIRAEGVTRILGIHALELTPCDKCLGNFSKESNCINIRKVMRDCNGNVALAARQLGVSRNTVYKHST